MTEPAIQDRIKRLISNEVLVGVSAHEIDSDASLISELHLDSIQMIALITGLENEFNFVLDDDDLDLENLSTVNRLASFVKTKLSSEQLNT